MGISYKVAVRSKLMPGKCLKNVQGVMLKVALGGLLGDLPGEKRGTGVKIGIVSERKNDSASKKGRIKHWTMSRASGHGQFDERDEELKRLHIYSGHLIFSLYGDSRKAMDPCNKGSPIHPTHEEVKFHT